MCGIAGLLRLTPTANVPLAELADMLRPIAHRGPDGMGLFVEGPVGLGHRRLAVIDLDSGSQPMANEDSTIHVVLNGEIYNFRELRRDLVARGHAFRTQSDTEVILHLYEEYGPACVDRLDGMFAFALWDRPRRSLLLARDRLGIKPLYYAATPHTLFFASELKALPSERGIDRGLDEAALLRFFDFSYVPGEATLFRGVRKLPPGHLLVVADGRVQLRRYWDLTPRPAFGGTFEEAAQALRSLLERTIQAHLVADVPVGVLLSGGVDSSAVLALAARQAGSPLRTFTVGYETPDRADERAYAREVAKAYGSIHREVVLGPLDFWEALPAYTWHMEEPVCEPPAIALHAVSRVAREDVTVLLSGEGGDEAFAGYPNYAHRLRLARIERLLGPLGRVLGAGGAALGKWLGSERLARYGAALGQPLARTYFSRASSPGSFFRRHRDEFFAAPWRRSSDAESLVGELLAAHPGTLLAQMLYVDAKTWLPDDLLVKADKMTMAHAVELRVPLLDHRVLEFAAGLPADFKVRGRDSKRVLKAACADLLPAAILRRPKAGFTLPYGHWLRGALAGRVRETLLAERARTRGYFEPAAVARLLDRHERTGRHGREVFALLALELWHQQFADRRAAAAVAA